MKKRSSTPSDDGRSLRRASSAPLSVICRRSGKEGEGNRSHKKMKMKEECDEFQVEEGAEECSARERLQRYRVQVAGSVWIPDSWDQEERLKEWVDPIALDRSLAPDGLLSARTALIRDCLSNRESDPPPPPVITCSQ
ncbi:hypothetical protein SUGI_0056130 [Cryptomeria japonica]|uniref:protein BIC1 n=1 Tax=Cryptomeria japonica TaxID=3369 RepID=UPI0024089E5F|nr:protein BIC1 [Cryptomeria japonica]GLJ07040.1 hypothetical protein SUGI_0056130 [Cryptomeria japonica]